MAKKGLFYFALGAAAAGAGLYLLRKCGGLHISIEVEPSDDGEWTPEAEIAMDDADIDYTVTEVEEAEAEANSEVI